MFCQQLPSEDVSGLGIALHSSLRSCFSSLHYAMHQIYRRALCKIPFPKTLQIESPVTLPLHVCRTSSMLDLISLNKNRTSYFLQVVQTQYFFMFPTLLLCGISCHNIINSWAGTALGPFHSTQLKKLLQCTDSIKTLHHFLINEEIRGRGTRIERMGTRDCKQSLHLYTS